MNEENIWRPVTGVFHIGFCVRNLDKSIEFYRDGLGLHLRHSQLADNPYTRSLVGFPEARLRVAQFQIRGQEPPASGHVLELIEYLEPPGPPADLQRNRLGAAHLAFAVEDIHSSLERVVSYGASPLNPPVEISAGINRGGWAVYFYDPDGVNLELIQLPTQFGVPSETEAASSLLAAPITAPGSRDQKGDRWSTALPPAHLRSAHRVKLFRRGYLSSGEISLVT
jgi:catechol 2,3-dioxygenase-like lactoylglutathione lyase family enzyme